MMEVARPRTGGAKKRRAATRHGDRGTPRAGGGIEQTALPRACTGHTEGTRRGRGGWGQEAREYRQTGRHTRTCMGLEGLECLDGEDYGFVDRRPAGQTEPDEDDGRRPISIWGWSPSGYGVEPLSRRGWAENIDP